MPKPQAKPPATEKPASSAAGKKQQKTKKPQPALPADKQPRKPQPQACPHRDTARATPATTAETTPVVDETLAEPRPEPQTQAMETDIPVVTPRPPTTPKSRIPPVILRDGRRWKK
ncbi:hypothetical protein Zmor_014674 [Zophobas morio]|uniref:Uncharacterized protein n=1 Tax=Zophobas morio TaxID=2755281 RepID=A0AA38MFT7_9CUCU|nr:hypothetical protein Zmor_014674 [Zophobas morio]